MGKVSSVLHLLNKYLTQHNMKTLKKIDELKFEPKTQVLAARFTDREAAIIREFCKKENIRFSDILRYSVKQVINNL